MGTGLGKQMRGTGQGEVKVPPNHNELTAVQHPNSKSRLGGSKSYAAGTPFRFQGSTALPICDIVLRCDKLNPVAKTFTISNKNPSFVSRGPEKVWASGIRPRSFFSLFDLFVIRACVQRLPAGVQTSLNDRSTQFKTQVSVSSISGLVHAGWKVMASRFAMQV